MCFSYFRSDKASQTFWRHCRGSVNRSLFFLFKNKNDMHMERDSRDIFVSRGKILIPTSSLTPPWPRSTTSPTQTHIPSFAGKHKLPEVLRSEIQPRDSPTSLAHSSNNRRKWSYILNRRSNFPIFNWREKSRTRTRNP